METDLRASRASGDARGEFGGAALSAALGGGAALLSAIVGIFAGVPFGALLLRALTGGAFIGILAFTAGLLLRRLLPELFGPASSAEQLASSGTSAYEAGEVGEAETRGLLGRRVDIVLPGGDEEEFPAASLVSPVVEAELEEELGYDGASLLEGGDSGSSQPRIATAALPKGGSPGFDDLDVLPDLESLSDSFLEMHPAGESYSESDSGQRRPATSSPPSSSYSSASGGSGSDPATLAQAVRTLLKRDQKG